MGLPPKILKRTMQNAKLLVKRKKLLRRIQVRQLQNFAKLHRNPKNGSWDSHENFVAFVNMTNIVDAQTAIIRKFSREKKFSYDPY